jgi:hypothetical protein
MVVTAGACSWPPTTNRGGPLAAFHACAETTMWDTVPLPRPHLGRQEERCVTLAAPVDDAAPSRGALDVAMIRMRPSRRAAGHLVIESSPRAAWHVPPHRVEVRAPGGHAC